MDESTKNDIEARINQEILKAQEDIVRLEAVNSPVSPDSAIGRLSRVEVINARSINDSALSQAKQRLAGLKSALANLNEPEFGTCFECGEPIPIARILLMPHTKMCVKCAELAE